MTAIRIVLVRLGLLAACATALFLDALVWRYFGWPTAITIAGGGGLLALLLSVDERPQAPRRVVGVAEHNAKKGERLAVDVDGDETFRRLR